MIPSTFTILVILALIFAVCGIIWNGYPLVPVAVILIAVALLVNK